jgi:hypothetical protein
MGELQNPQRPNRDVEAVDVERQARSNDHARVYLQPGWRARCLRARGPTLAGQKDQPVSALTRVFRVVPAHHSVTPAGSNQVAVWRARSEPSIENRAGETYGTSTTG